MKVMTIATTFLLGGTLSFAAPFSPSSLFRRDTNGEIQSVVSRLSIEGHAVERCSTPCTPWLSSISSCGNSSSSNSTASCLCETPAVKGMISCATCIGAIETDWAKNASNNCAILTGHNVTDSGNGVEGRVGASLFALGLVGVAVLV
ncbi:hypothetical protein OF846_001894 [Rhodotorula toruloides]|nr:hypothetical protein OF846_001894 [Rhodotorula toruloides]